jgi:long-chain acyl-CoA synthetase
MATEAVEARGRTVSRSATRAAERFPERVAIRRRQEEIIPWARAHGLPEDIPSLVERDEVRELIQAELDRLNAGYAQVEQIKKFTVLDHDLSQEGGELTRTLKLKRNVVSDPYADSSTRCTAEPGLAVA